MKKKHVCANNIAEEVQTENSCHLTKVDYLSYSWYLTIQKIKFTSCYILLLDSNRSSNFRTNKICFHNLLLDSNRSSNFRTNLICSHNLLPLSSNCSSNFRTNKICFHNLLFLDSNRSSNFRTNRNNSNNFCVFNK